MPRFHVRCRKCDARRVLPKHPDEYVRLPACNSCQAKDYRVDRWMMRRNTRDQGCWCGGYWFFHRRGSKYCHHRKDGTMRLEGDPDFADRGYEQWIAEGGRGDESQELVVCDSSHDG